MSSHLQWGRRIHHSTKIIHVRSNYLPDQAATCKVSIRILQGDEDLRSKLIWVKDCKSMLAGLNITSVTPALTLLSSIMSETCYGHLTLAANASAELNKEAAIKTAEEANDDEAKTQAEARAVDDYRTLDDVKNAISQVVKENLPYKCYRKSSAIFDATAGSLSI